MIPRSGDDPIRAELAAGERVVWLGRPRPGARRSRGHALVLRLCRGAGIVWLGLLVVVAIGSLAHGNGLPLGAAAQHLLLGLALLSARSWPSRWAGRTAYVITDRRALVAEPVLGQGLVVRSYEARDLDGCRLNVKRDGKGTGDLLFNNPGVEHGPPPEGFLAIADVRRVDALLRRTLLGGAATGPPRSAPPEVTVARIAASAAGWDGPIRAALAADERLLWLDQPDPRRLARAAWPLVVFGLPWIGGTALWIARAGGEVSWGLTIPFLFVGLFCCTSPLWIGGTAGRVAYALTDRRVLLCDPHPFGGVILVACDLAGITACLRRERPDGSGDLVFPRLRAPAGDEDSQRRGFLGIAVVARVEALLHAARADL